MPTIDFLVASVLVLIMFGIGVSLNASDIKIVLTKPKALIVSLASQMFLLPLIAFGICSIFDMPAYIKIGLVILAASPGGTTSGFITFLFKGNVALSVILTTINSILILFTIPLIVNFALLKYSEQNIPFHLPFIDTVKEVFVLTAIPATIGIFVRYKSEVWANKIAKLSKPILIILLGIVFLLKFIGGQDGSGITKQEIIDILPFALILNVACYFTGYALTRVFKLGYKNEITTSVESAVHNTTMAFLISSVLIHNEQYGKVSLVYAMFSFWTAILFCLLISKLRT